MLMVIRFCSPPYSASASASAVSVLPTPDGPHSMNTPIGLDGLSRPAREVCTRLAIISQAVVLADHALRRACRPGSAPPGPRSCTIRPTGMPVQSPTTAATACSSTLGRISGVSPWCAASSACSVSSASSRQRSPPAHRRRRRPASAAVGAPATRRRAAARAAPACLSTSAFSLAQRASSAASVACSVRQRRSATLARGRSASMPIAVSRPMISQLGLQRLRCAGGNRPPRAARRAG